MNPRTVSRFDRSVVRKIDRPVINVFGPDALEDCSMQIPGLYVSVDETGDVGSNANSEWFLMGATVATDEVVFAEATPYITGQKREPKFNKDVDLRVPILKAANPVVKHRYYVAVLKDGSYDSDQQHTIHRRALEGLADIIIQEQDHPYLDVDIDRTTMISNHEAAKLFTENPYKEDYLEMDVSVLDSRISRGLQTNDFVVGSMGWWRRNLDKNNGRDPYAYVKHVRSPMDGYEVSADELLKNRNRNNALIGRHNDGIEVSEQPTHRIPWYKRLRAMKKGVGSR